MNRGLLYTIAALLLLSACKKEMETKYYDNSEVKYEVPLVDGKRHGMLVEYFKDGKVSAYSNWKNGKLEGKSVVYYENGTINQENFFKNGVRCCSSKFYSPDGRLIEIQYFDSLGRIFDYKKFTKDGNQNLDPETRLPIIISTSDTVDFGDYFLCEIRLGNRRFDNIDVVIGSLVYDSIISNPRLPKKDSVTAVLQIKASKPGSNTVEGVILETNRDNPDSILVIPFKTSFYVREPVRPRI